MEDFLNQVIAAGKRFDQILAEASTAPISF